MAYMINIQATVDETRRQNLHKTVTHYLGLNPTTRHTILAAFEQKGITLLNANLSQLEEAAWLARCLAYGNPECAACWSRNTAPTTAHPTPQHQDSAPRRD